MALRNSASPSQQGRLAGYVHVTRKTWMEQHSTSVENVGRWCYCFWEHLQVELDTILIINKILANNNSMLLKALLNIYQLVSNFNLLLSLIDTKFVIHLHNSISLTIFLFRAWHHGIRGWKLFLYFGRKKKSNVCDNPIFFLLVKLNTYNS